MVRIRTHKTSKYFSVSNETAQDQNISFAALGLLTYCLSMPPDWDFNPKIIWKSRDLGRDSVYNCFNELIKNYKCIRIRNPNPKAKHLPGTIEYEIFDDSDDCKNRIKELEQQNEKFIDHAGNLKKCFRYPDPQDPKAWDPENQDTTKETELYKEKKQQQTKQEASPPKRAKPAAAASFDKLNKKEKIKKLKGLGVFPSAQDEPYECLTDIDIPYKEMLWLTKTYDEDTVKYAIDYCLNPNVKIETTFIQTLKWACKTKPEIPKEKLTPYEELSQVFKNYEKYNDTSCYIDEKSISFERGMKHATIMFSYFSWDAFDRLCQDFGFKFDRVNKKVERLP